MSSPNRRRDSDVTNLMMKDFNVQLISDDFKRITVEFPGPETSLYAGGLWKIGVRFWNDYPYRAPVVFFMNKICDPNIQEESGMICLDVLNQNWSAMYDMVNVFEIFLPQLLLYPNPSDPLNQEAASLMFDDRPTYDQRVRETVSDTRSQKM